MDELEFILYPLYLSAFAPLYFIRVKMHTRRWCCAFAFEMRNSSLFLHLFFSFGVFGVFAFDRISSGTSNVPSLRCVNKVMK